MEDTRVGFGSKIGGILAAAGSAVVGKIYGDFHMNRKS